MSKGKRKTVVLRRTVLLDAPIRALWPLLANTDQRNKRIKVPVVKQEEVPDPRGGSMKFHRMELLGHKVNIRELPFEWCRERYVEEVRMFDAGPLQRMAIRTDCEEEEGGRCRVDTVVTIEVSWRFLLPLLYVLSSWKVGTIQRHYGNLAQSIKEQRRLPHRTHVEEKREGRLAADHPVFMKLAAKWNAAYSDYHELTEPLIRYVLEAPEEEVRKIRPYRVAARLGLDKRAVLIWMLRATLIGILDLQWQILCPSCRGGHAVTSLRDLQANVHCPSCNISYEADFERSVEVSFTPHASIRSVDTRTYCMGSPARTLHILAQIRLEPGNEKEIALALEEGVHRIYSPHFSRTIVLDVKALPESDRENRERDDGEADHRHWMLDFGAEDTGETRMMLPTGRHIFRFGNRDAEDDLLVRLERGEWLDDIVTATEVSALQEFRAQFSAEVLSPDVEIKVNHVTILFTDLKNSTAFYNDMGDAVAFRVVKEHFDVLQNSVDRHGGAIVKTIGDAIMAVFTRPENGVAAALSIHDGIQAFNRDLPAERRVTVKSGLHSGPALAVNLNERLDYFGHTVNLAARANGQSRGGDVILTDSLYAVPDVQRFLREQPHAVESFRTSLKGFADDQLLYRIFRN